MQLREGEVVDFILRQVPKDGFKRSAANRATEATKEMAEQLGVDLSTLARGVSKIRSDEDPILSSKLVQSLIEQTNSYWIKWISACASLFIVRVTTACGPDLTLIPQAVTRGAGARPVRPLSPSMLRHFVAQD
jgi:hypothetical protein